eukprot:6891612-Alexandrium_andersonii.AAC.1
MATVRLLEAQPFAVIAVVLGRPSSWAEVGDVSRALSVGLKRAHRVFDGSYDRDAHQEEWANSRPFDRSGN